MAGLKKPLLPVKAALSGGVLQLTSSHLSQNCAISRPSSSVTSSRPVSLPLPSPSHDEETPPNNAYSTTSDSGKEEVRTTGKSSKTGFFFFNWRS